MASINLQQGFVKSLPDRNVDSASIALRYEGRSVSYGELERRAKRLQSSLLEMGIENGARIGWLGRSCPDYFTVFFGAAKARACFVPFNTRLAEPELAHVLRDSEPSALFITQEYAEKLQSVTGDAGYRSPIIAVDFKQEGFLDLDALLDDGDPADIDLPTEDDDVMLQLYTSGTTGLPKGVRITNRNYRAFLNDAPQVEGLDNKPSDRVLIVMPLFHIAGINFSLAALSQGCELTIMSEFRAERVLWAIEEFKVTHLFLVPAMIQMLLDTPRIADSDLTSLKVISYGASPISETLLGAASDRFGCGFVQFYGMTETTGSGTYLPSASHQPGLLKSCGIGWPSMAVRILDASGAELPPRSVGEIALRGPMVMAGYWRLDEATAKVVEDGWLRTGDVGFKDEAGYVYVHDRVKDMIVSGGENIYPAEVENAISACAGVAEVAVIGVPSDRWGEEAKAFVVRGGNDVDEAAVIAWARRHLAGYKVPKSVEFVESLPRNASGKILRRILRAPYWEDAGRNI